MIRVDAVWLAVQIDVLVDVKPTIGEGLVWDVQEQRLYWIDILGCRVFRCTADGRVVRAWDVPDSICSMALRRGGGAVVSLFTGFHVLDFEVGDTRLIVNPAPDKPHTWLNDGKVDEHRGLCALLSRALVCRQRNWIVRPPIATHTTIGVVESRNSPARLRLKPFSRPDERRRLVFFDVLVRRPIAAEVL